MFALLGVLLDVVTWVAIIAFVATGFAGGPLQAIAGGSKAKYLALGAGGLALALLTWVWLPGLLLASYGGYKVVEQRQQRKALGGRPNTKGYLGR